VAAPAIAEVIRPILIKKFGIEVRPAPGSGARVSGVMGNSYAANAGLRAGDIIIECNGTSVRGVDQFQRLVSMATPEADAQIRIMRGGRARDLLIMVGEGEMEGFTPIRRL
jgi:S1-C subfamily serine protease